MSTNSRSGQCAGSEREKPLVSSIVTNSRPYGREFTSRERQVSTLSAIPEKRQPVSMRENKSPTTHKTHKAKSAPSSRQSVPRRIRQSVRLGANMIPESGNAVVPNTDSGFAGRCQRKNYLLFSNAPQLFCDRSRFNHFYITPCIPLPTAIDTSHQILMDEISYNSHGLVRSPLRLFHNDVL